MSCKTGVKCLKLFILLFESTNEWVEYSHLNHFISKLLMKLNALGNSTVNSHIISQNTKSIKHGFFSKTRFWDLNLKMFLWHFTIGCIIFGDSLMFYQIFLSPQVKRWVIITFKHGVYESPQELPNDWRLKILGNWEKLGKCLNFIEW